MALLDNAKDWVILAVVGGFFGVVFWSGWSVLTLKTMLLWILISFGFLTLILHALGSPLIALLSKFFKREEVPKKSKFSKEQLAKQRQKLLEKKQELFDDKSHQFKEDILDPRAEAQRLKKEAEANMFTQWKGQGHKLGSDAPQSCTCGHPHHDIDTDPDSLIDNVDYADTSSDDEPVKEYEVNADIEITAAATGGNTLRQRKGEQVKGSTADTDSNLPFNEEQIDTEMLSAEPEIGLSGVVTVALRCPNGNTTKRRFNIKSKLEELVTYAETLGYPSTQFVIMSTYPRKPLEDPSLTFEEAGLTQDVVLVIDEKDD